MLQLEKQDKSDKQTDLLLVPRLQALVLVAKVLVAI
jgi:hypothetical protein